jgi:hypothetical protein
MRRTHRSLLTRVAAAAAAVMLALPACGDQVQEKVSSEAPQASNSPQPSNSPEVSKSPEASKPAEPGGDQNTPRTGVSARDMLTAADVAKVYRAGTWKLSKEGPGDGSEGFYHDFTCQQAILGSLRSQRSGTATSPWHAGRRPTPRSGWPPSAARSRPTPHSRR